MDLKLEGKSVLVLAASSGIGKGVALEFAREKAKVMIVGRSKERLKKSADDIESLTGNRPLIHTADLNRLEEIESAVKKAELENGSVYALFNNTGGPPPGKFDDFDDDAWIEAFKLTFLSFVRSIRLVLPSMKRNGGGRIVNNTSSSIKHALDHLLLSNSFRTGLVGFTKSLARELGEYNILLNVVGAGKIKTPRVNQIDTIKATRGGMSLKEFQDKNAATIPLGRYGEPDEMGRLVTFLCSEANTYITGQNILVDGGLVDAY